jgi:hypothetical protein
MLIRKLAQGLRREMHCSRKCSWLCVECIFPLKDKRHNDRQPQEGQMTFGPGRIYPRPQGEHFK